MLNLDRVRALCAVAQSGSVAAAARVLHVTPSGVSQQLAKLEREVGVALLEPAGRGVRLTPAGELLARRGGELLARTSGIEAEIAAMRSEVVGPLRFGAFVTASRVVLPSAVSALLSRYPLHVTVTEAETEVTLESVARGRIDVGIVDSWESAPVDIPSGLEARLIHRDAADVALSVDHPLARDAVVELSNLAEMPWVAWGSGTTFHDWLVRSLRRQGFEPRIDFEASDISTHLAFVAAGLAAALVPRLAMDMTPAGAVLVATEPRLHRDIYAVWRADNAGPAVRAGIDAVQDAFGRRGTQFTRGD
ncbi:DNA-binding transcriptional LysR family regulator [Rhodococcus sp. OK519]|uniref:LysR family transcriptional regulator n=1 Tax=Rhodococcus sp. OK519 TaxID=2135729 RepID=UPI000D3C1FBB|nr:DNA-binding transcriptional LysR family regulator [Rhodococcus sp. OK519]